MGHVANESVEDNSHSVSWVSKRSERKSWGERPEVPLLPSQLSWGERIKRKAFARVQKLWSHPIRFTFTLGTGWVAHQLVEGVVSGAS